MGHCPVVRVLSGFLRADASCRTGDSVHSRKTEKNHLLETLSLGVPRKSLRSYLSYNFLVARAADETFSMIHVTHSRDRCQIIRFFAVFDRHAAIEADRLIHGRSARSAIRLAGTDDVTARQGSVAVEATEAARVHDFSIIGVRQ